MPRVAVEPQRGRRAPARADAPEVRVLRQFRQVFNAVKTHFQQLERRAGLGGAPMWALSVVAGAPGIGVGGLAAAMDIHPSTASNLVRTLAERGFVQAERDQLDRRAVRLTLRPAATRLLRRTPGPFEGVLPEALAALDARTLKRLEADLGRLIAVLDVDESAARIPLADL